MTWTNATQTARIERVGFNTYRLLWWPKDPLRSPQMSKRDGASILAAERFAKRHDIQTFFETPR